MLGWAGAHFEALAAFLLAGRVCEVGGGWLLGGRIGVEGGGFLGAFLTVPVRGMAVRALDGNALGVAAGVPEVIAADAL